MFLFQTPSKKIKALVIGLGLQFDLAFVASTGVPEYRNTIKNKVRDAALKFLKGLQQTHIKVKHIRYEKPETQPYLKSHIFSNQT